MTTINFTKEQLFADLKNDRIAIGANTINKAKNGDDQAMSDIGHEYQFKKQQYDKAMAWYRLAVVKNNPSAQNRIGVLYNYGQGVPVNYLLAMEWYLKAALQNNKNAWRNIGDLFEEGEGVPVDKYKALEWYTKSGERPDKVKELTDQGIHLTQQNKNKSIEQLVMETEDIVWPGRGHFREKILKEKETTLFQKLMSRLEGEQPKNGITDLQEVNAKLERKLIAKDYKIMQLEQEKQALEKEMEIMLDYILINIKK